LIADYIEKNIYLPNEIKLDYIWEKCTGHSAVNHNYRLKTSCYCTGNSQSYVRYSILRYGQLEYKNIIKISKQFSYNYRCLSMLSMTIYMTLNVPYVRNEIRRRSQKYIDRMKDHLNILTKNLIRNVKTPRRLKKDLHTIYVPIYVTGAILWNTRQWAYTLQDFITPNYHICY